MVCAYLEGSFVKPLISNSSTSGGCFLPVYSAAGSWTVVIVVIVVIVVVVRDGGAWRWRVVVVCRWRLTLRVGV